MKNEHSRVVRMCPYPTSIMSRQMPTNAPRHIHDTPHDCPIFQIFLILTLEG